MFHRTLALTPLACVLLWLTAWAGSGAATPALAADPTGLVDFAQTLTRDDPFADVDIAIRLVDARPLPGKGGDGDAAGGGGGGGGGDVVVLLRRRGGTWETGHIAAADYNQKSDNTADPSGLTFEGHKITGTLHVTISPDSPRPNSKDKGFPYPADAFTVDLEMAMTPGTPAPYQPDLEAFMPPWRKDIPTYGGTLATGTYTGTLTTGEGEQPIQGTATGAVAPAPLPGKWGTSGSLSISPANGDAPGMSVLARLAPQRVAPPEEAWAVLPYEEPTNLLGTGGLQLRVSSSQRRDDAAMALAVRVQGGGWSQVTSAGLLLGPEPRDFNVRWDQFRPRLSPDDLRHIEAIRVGVDNPLGVADVAFTLHSITIMARVDEEPRDQPVITLHPDIARSYNGTTTIPSGVFGFHQVHSPKLDPAPEGKPDPIEYLKELNPGLLRPLTHTGFGGKPLTNEDAAAKLAQHIPTKNEYHRRGVEAGAVNMLIETYTEDLWNRPSWMNKDQADFLSGVETFWRNRAASSWTPGDDENLDRMYEVWNEPFMWGRHINMGFMNPAGQKAWTDDTQYGYLPGTLGAEVIGETYLAAKRGAAVNEHVLLGGPSAPSIDGNYYGTMEDYIVPFLQTEGGGAEGQAFRVGNVLDFFTEHHYGGDPAANAASYEVFTAYMDTTFDRRIPIYNTEANNLGASPAGKARYNTADILRGIEVAPDILQGRSLHALWSGYLNDEGEEAAYRLLSPLRGTMIVSETNRPDLDGIITIASTPEEGKLVVVVLNDEVNEQTITLAGVAGFKLVQRTLLLGDAPRNELRLRDVDGAMVLAPAAGKVTLVDTAVDNQPLTVTLPRGSAARWIFEREGYAAEQEQTRTQHYLDAVLADVAAEQPLQAKVRWHGEAKPQEAEKAWLRVITRDVHEGEAIATLGGTDIPLPWSSSNDGQAVVQMIEIDPALIRDAAAPITFRITDPTRFNGFTLYAASVVLEE